MNREAEARFKAFKRRFKKNKPCADCGKRFKASEMSVDHIIPIYEFRGSPYDTRNWQVLCIPCHRKKTDREIQERKIQND